MDRLDYAIAASVDRFATAAPAGDDLFELAPEAQVVIDPFADRLLAANAAFRRMMGFSTDEVCEVVPSHWLGEAIADLIVFTQAVIETGSGWTNSLRCRDCHGRSRRMECHAVRIGTADAPAMLATLRDLRALHNQEAESQANEFVRRGLSEWRRVETLFEEIEQENKLILQAAGEGIYGVNAEGATTFVNPAAERMLGYSADELVGKNMHSLLHHSHPDGSHYAACDCPIYAAFKDGAVHQVTDEVFWRKDGGAFPVEYTSTPIREKGRLVGAVVVFRDVSERKETEQKLHQALEELERLKQRLELENAYLQEEIREEYNYQEIVGRSDALRKTIQKIEMVAPTDAAVLITGESGTGKELIARAIHQSSARCDRPLIRVNCAAVPRELFESEFFGHVKGAYTGAVRDRAGRFELADGGTLFLDEVGEIPLELQSKLLRVLQEGQCERVGSDRTITVDVRIIAATNRDLSEEVAEGRFREDLFFRLNVFPIESAPLRERPEDIPLLASHFLANACRRFGREGLRLSGADVQRLQAYDWPGNVRELENVLERAVIISRNNQLRLELPDVERPASKPMAPSPEINDGLMTEQQKRERDRRMIMQALEASGGKIFGAGGAAELLGVKPTTLASRIKRWGIDKKPRSG
ncbi:sigma 54-interacting transcriptional regulator [Thiosocius teredinicola]|uniref:sigma 54-interacting transcriptional regulator n=1 Tax=Thiosocius teredinicola TaxID=1973002 RepID=UPI000990E1A2